MNECIPSNLGLNRSFWHGTRFPPGFFEGRLGRRGRTLLHRRELVALGDVDVVMIASPDHFLDWLQCIRSRRQCRAGIEAGYQHAVAVILAMLAYDTGRRQVYDAEKRETRPG